MRTVRVICLVGAGRSGSTLLSRMLDMEAGTTALGETSNLLSQRDITCGCGHIPDRCPVWGPVLRAIDEMQLFEEWQHVQHLSRIQKLSSLRRVGRRRMFDASLTSFISETYVRLAQETASDILVDESKWPFWALLLSEAPAIDLHIVRLIRDPREVARSRFTSKPHPGIETRDMKAWAVADSARDWVMRESFASLVHGALRGLPSSWISMQQVLSDPVQIVESLTANRSTGLAKEDGAWTFDAGPNHIIASNPDKYRRGPERLRIEPSPDMRAPWIGDAGPWGTVADSMWGRRRRRVG